MNQWLRILSVVLLLGHMASLAAADPKSDLVSELNPWPHVMLGAGVLYTPAPVVLDREGGRTDKLLDRLGWQLALEWRVLEYMTVGGQFSGLYSSQGERDDGTSLLEAGVRLGALIPLGERWALRAVVTGGVSGLRTDGPDRVSPYDRRYWGFQAWAIAGLIYRLSRDFILYADISGTTTRYDATSWISVHSPDFEPYDDPNIFRLQFGIGIAICWEKVQWRPPPEVSRRRQSFRFTSSTPDRRSP